MAKGPKTTTTIIILMFVIIVGVTAIDLYRDYHMKENAEECGFIKASGVSKECKCAGNMVDDGSLMNPMLKKAGEVNYYCYGECLRCRCYYEEYDRRIGNFTKVEVNCSAIG
jgi:hypothetical protein